MKRPLSIIVLSMLLVPVLVSPGSAVCPYAKYKAPRILKKPGLTGSKPAFGGSKPSFRSNYPSKPTVGRPKIINVPPGEQQRIVEVAPGAARPAGEVEAAQAAIVGQPAAPGDPLLWRVTSPTATVYLLGSLHVADKRLFPLDERVDNAFHTSGTVVFETEMGPIASTQIQRLLQLYGAYPAGESLDQHVDPELLRKLDALLEQQKIDRASMHRMRPWYVGLTLTMIAYRRAGFSSEYGIEEHFRGQSTRKTVEHIETIAEQTDVFRRMPEGAQLEALRASVERFDELGSELGRCIDAWKAGDIGQLETTMLDPVRQASPEFYASMMTNRNKTMAAAVERYLEKKGTTLVVIGSGHLLGDGSVLGLLAGHGYASERL